MRGCDEHCSDCPFGCHAELEEVPVSSYLAVSIPHLFDPGRNVVRVTSVGDDFVWLTNEVSCGTFLDMPEEVRDQHWAMMKNRKGS